MRCLELGKMSAFLKRASGRVFRGWVNMPLMFDSEHFIKRPLVRETNWEIHPILKLEYCPDGSCSASSDQGWQDLDGI